MTSPAFVIMSKLKNDASVGIVHDTQIPTINYLYNTSLEKDQWEVHVALYSKSMSRTLF